MPQPPDSAISDAESQLPDFGPVSQQALKLPDFGSPRLPNFGAPKLPDFSTPNIVQLFLSAPPITPYYIGHNGVPYGVHQPTQASSGYFPMGSVNPPSSLNSDDFGLIAAMGEAQKNEPMAEHVFDFFKNMFTAPLTVPLTMAGKVLETPAAAMLNTFRNTMDIERGVAPPREQFQPGKAIVPEPPANATGVLASLQRAISPTTTPGSLGLFVGAPEYDALKAMFLSSAVGSVPDSVEQMATAKTRQQFMDAATQLGLNFGMTALMARGHGAEQETPETAPATATPAETAATTPNAPPAESPKVDVSQFQANDIQAALQGNQIAPTVAVPPIDTGNAEVRAPDGQIDPVQTVIAQMKLNAVQKAASEPPPPPPAGNPPVEASQPAQGADQILPKVSEPPRVQTTDDTSVDEPSQPAHDATAPPVPVASKETAFSPSGESDLTPNKSQQIIQQAIDEKHAKAATTKVFREDRNRWNDGDIRRAESTFRRISQKRPQIYANTAHDADFYQTEIAQRLRAIAKRHGTDVGFFKGTDDGPSGLYRDGRIWVRTNRTAPELIRSFEHEMAHHREVGPIVSVLKKAVDLNSRAAQRVVTTYNDFLAQRGQPPLTEDRARAEVVAPFLAADTRYGDLSAAFNNPDEAVKLAQDYHVPGGSAGSAGRQTRGLTFEPGDVGETGRERAPPPATVPPAPVVSQISQPRSETTESVPGLTAATPTASKPNQVFSLGGMGGLDDEATQAGVSGYLRRQKNVPQIQIVNDPSWTHNGYGVRGTVQDGRIIVNRAFIESNETLQQVLREEHNHLLLSSDEGRAGIRNAVQSNLGDSQFSTLAKQYPRQQGEAAADWKARLTDEFIAKAASEELPVWKETIERVKTWLADKGIGKLSDAETARAIVRALKSDKAAVEPVQSAFDDHSAEENDGFISRYNLTDEPLDGMSARRATESLNQFFGTKQLPSGIRVIRSRTILWDATNSGRGSIVLNAAQISTPEQAQQAVLREGLRGVWYQPEVQKAWQYVRSKLSPAEMTVEFNRRKAQGLHTDPTTVREKAAIARLINSDGRDRVIENFHDAIRAALKRRFDLNVPATARPLLKEAVIQFLRNRIVLPSTPTSNLSLIPMAAVSRGEWGEARLDQVLGGRAIKPSKGFKTDLGTRFIDRFLHEIAHESKAGSNMKLNSKMKTQALKDAELIRAGKIHGAHWHFFQGAHPDTLKFLEQNGIGYTVY